MNALLVEDDIYLRQRLGELLSDLGFSYCAVSSAQGALQIDAHTYQFAILDVMLPNDPAVSGIPEEEARGGFLTGVAVARRLRQRCKDLSIILLSADTVSQEAKTWAKDHGVVFIHKDEGRKALVSALEHLGLIPRTAAPKAFIVHGHDDAALAELQDYLRTDLCWEAPIVLREQPNQGRTIIEKFEEISAGVEWVFVLLTPDDHARAMKTNDEKRRARQNVIFELGFFYGLMGRRRGRVIVLRKGEVEIPSDLQGIIWIDIQDGIRAHDKEIRAEVMQSI